MSDRLAGRPSRCRRVWAGRLGLLLLAGRPLRWLAWQPRQGQSAAEQQALRQSWVWPRLQQLARPQGRWWAWRLVVWSAPRRAEQLAHRPWWLVRTPTAAACQPRANWLMDAREACVTTPLW